MEYIGYRYTTSMGNVVEVKERFVNKSQSNFILECEVCSKDKELFPYGSIRTTLSSVKAGRCPCGCSKRYRYSREQNVLLVQRKCRIKGFTFLGFKGGYKGKSATKLILKDNAEGDVWETTTLQSFLLNNGGNPRKNFRSLAGMSIKDDSEFIKRFLSTGVFEDGSKFERLEDGYWNYWCPKCSVDEYAQDGLCDGWFKYLASHLMKGKKPCRCTGKVRWTPDQRLRDIKLKGLERGINVLGWEGEYVSTRDSYVKWVCNKGHEGVSKSAKFLHKNHGCPKCSAENNSFSFYQGKVFEPDYLYVLSFTNKNENFIKVGRSFDPVSRYTSFPKEYRICELFTIKRVHLTVDILEKKLHKIFKDFRYVPQIPFKGHTECFNIDVLDAMHPYDFESVM